MNVKQINVEQAHQILRDSTDAVYVDVRTAEEFAAGHAPRAINIPVVFPDAATRGMMPNPDFLRVVQAHVPKDRQVILGCKMGGRSQLAAEHMAAAGYADVANMHGGFSGARDPMGQLVAPGWVQHEYPVETEVTAANGYEGLKQAAG